VSSLASRLEVDLSNVLGTSGFVVLVLGLAQLVLVPVALWGGAPVLALGGGSLGAILAGLVLVQLRRRAQKFTRRESLATVVMSWFAATIVAAVPFVVTGACGVPDALFESASGLTTTGGTVFVDVDHLRTDPGDPGSGPALALVPALHLWRGLTHWFGGAGIVLIVLVLTPFLADTEALRRTQRAEASLLTERYRGSTKATVRGLLSVYLAATVTQTLLLIPCGMTPWDAMLHSFASIATGGFSTRTASLGHPGWGTAAQLVTVVFMLVGALNFALLGRVWEIGRANVFRDAPRTGWTLAVLRAARDGPLLLARTVWRSGEARGYLLMLAGASVFIAVTLVLSPHGPRYEGGQGVVQASVDAAFNAASLSSTTGFVTEDFTRWPTSCQVVLFVLILIGGCTGSTAGGIKFRRVSICVKAALREARRFAHPRAVFLIRVGDDVVSEEQVRESIGFTTTYLGLALVATLVVAVAGKDPLTSGGAAAACLGSVGPGFGECGPAGSFQPFLAWTKLALVFVMLLGRLEVLPLLSVCLPSFWLRRRSTARTRPPEHAEG
jgi:trk system potassium uptake protein TrkH